MDHRKRTCESNNFGTQGTFNPVKLEVDALGVITILCGVLSAAAAISKLPHTILILVLQRFEPCGRRCSVRPHTVRRPRLALGDGAATRVGFFGLWFHYVNRCARTPRVKDLRVNPSCSNK